MQSQGQFIAESSQRPSATQLQTCSRGTVDGLSGEASKYTAVAAESQTSARTNGTMRPSSYHTRAFVAHCTHASQGYRGLHATSAASRPKRSASQAMRAIHSMRCAGGNEGLRSALSTRFESMGEKCRERVAWNKRPAAVAASGKPIDPHPKAMPSALKALIHRVSTSAPNM